MVRSSALYAVALVVAVAVVAPLAPTQASFLYTEEDLASDDSMWALYERWAAYHVEDVVREPGEMARRFPIFKSNARRLLDKSTNKEGKAVLNLFGDRTFDEITAFAAGTRESEEDVECRQSLPNGSEHEALLRELVECTLNSP